MESALQRLGLLARMLGAQAPPLAWLEPAPGPLSGPLPGPLNSHLDPRAWWLPRDDDAQVRLARLAHAVAHHRFGLAPQPRGTLRPLQQALFGLIEDARVEGLLGREFPGLQAVWAARHDVPPDAAPTVESLLRRLARALADPAFDDRHPWVHAARARVRGSWGDRWDDVRGMRALASRMGHELGQMRLGFDARGYRVQPGYRDDHACLWDAPADTPEQQVRELCVPAAAAQSAPPPPADGTADDRAGQATDERGVGPGGAQAAVACTLAEWDWRIRRHRPGWCTVREQRAVPAAGAEPARVTRECAAHAGALLRRWERQAQARRGRAQAEGEHPEPRALADWLLSRAGDASAEPRLFRGPARARAGRHLLVLLDCSASSGAGPGGAERFARACGTALALLSQARARSWSCALAGFSSDTRHHVRVVRVQDFGERPTSRELAARVQGLRAEWSTRLGAALRYAALRLRKLPAGSERRLLLISDGQARDVDVHDPRYLRADLARARRELAAASVWLDEFWPAGTSNDA